MRRQAPSRVEELVKIFIHALKVSNEGDVNGPSWFLTYSQMEIGFWEMFPYK